MADRIEHDPSEIAPVAGEYELPSIFGSATGGRVCVMQGHLFPTAPSGHKWALLEQDNKRSGGVVCDARNGLAVEGTS